MWCVAIRPENEQALIQEFEEAKRYAKTIEIRLDAFYEIPWNLLAQFVQDASVIFSLSQKQVDPEVYYRLASLKPHFLDIAHTVDFEVFYEIRKRYSEVLLIASYHNFEKTPENLDEIFDTLQSYPAHHVKCVTMAHSSIDGLKMLASLQKYEKQKPTSGFCMGQEAVFTRLVAPIFGSQMSYYCLPGRPTALGQQTLHERISVTEKTFIYALIGYPIAHSLSHITHNKVFQKNNLDSVYVKIPLVASEYDAAMRYFYELSIKGLSVTMPLKDKVVGNTVRFDKETHAVCNTDGTGMLDAIEQKVNVKNKRMLILGAGFTGKTIAEEAIKRGALVCIANRTHQKANRASAKLECTMAPWDKKTIQNGS